MQRVIREVRDSLCDLKLAIDGTIVMSPSLRASLDAMYDARIPEKWMKVERMRPEYYRKSSFFFFCSNVCFISSDFMGIDNAWVLVHRTAGTKSTISNMVPN